MQEEIAEEKLGAEEPPLEAPIETPDEPTGDIPGETPAEAPAEGNMVDWSQYAERYGGRPLDEVLGYFQGRESQYGQQANELGRLRQIEQQFNQIQNQVTGKPAEKKKVEFSEVENRMFIEKLNSQNPMAAISEMILPKLTESLRGEMMKDFSQQIGPVLNEQFQNVTSQQEWNAFVKAHPDYAEYKPLMHSLMAPDYLGQGAPYEDVYGLAKLAKEEPSLFSTTCGLLQCGVPFEKAKKFATLERDAGVNAESQKERIKQEVGKIGPGVKRAGAKQMTSEPEVMTMDDAFAPD